MLKLTGMLFAYEPKSEYMDYFERTLYNHIAATQDQSGAIGGSTYFMPLHPGAQKGYDSTHNTCCHGTGLENHVKYQDAIYYLRRDDGKSAYINLYIPSVLDVDGGGSLLIDGDFLANSGKAVVKITRDGFDELRLRVPSWHGHDGGGGAFAVNLNGKSAKYPVESGYAVVKPDGGFKAGDIIEAAFDFKFRLEPEKDVPEICSLCYGPLVMTALDEGEKYIALDEGFEGRLEKTGGLNGLEFTLDGRKFVPNYYADTGKYHAYFRRV